MAKAKPKKPFKKYPLFPHASGQWAKTILGKHYYFGKWDDPDAALESFLAKKDYLYAGKVPPNEDDYTSTTLADLLNSFLESKQLLLDQGHLKQRTFNEYTEITDTISATIGKRSPLESIKNDDLRKLWVALGKGKNGKPTSPSRHKIKLGIARMVFNYCNEVLDISIRYKKALQSPSAKIIRKAQAAKGERMFKAEEIRQLLDIAKPQMKAMIYLGINCGFGNEDCATLTMDKLDLDGGWHRHPRPKTGVVRHCKLWRETVTALKDAIKQRPTPKDPRNNDLVFVTKYGQPWSDVDGGRNNDMAQEFRKLTSELGIHRKSETVFYSLRRTHQTVGETAQVPQRNTVSYIMGHLADANDMAAVYRQKTFDASIQKVTSHVRRWLQGKVNIA